MIIKVVTTWCALLLVLMSSAIGFARERAVDLTGKYKSEDGVVIEFKKIDEERYIVSSDHSGKPVEAGHNWSGVGMISKGNFIGVFKYLDDDSKYQGFLGIQHAETEGNCLIITGSQYSQPLKLEGKLGPFKYCKI